MPSSRGKLPDWHTRSIARNNAISLSHSYSLLPAKLPASRTTRVSYSICVLISSSSRRGGKAIRENWVRKVYKRDR
eukprot:scaffold27447_cov62-Phaeocystis_antarctica.AAC.4